jgi:hypothetical protein
MKNTPNKSISAVTDTSRFSTTASNLELEICLGTAKQSVVPTPDAFRVLRPGGKVRLPGLGGDKPVQRPLDGLPGPAASVKHALPEGDQDRALVAAGFVDVRSLWVTALSGAADMPQCASVLHSSVSEALSAGFDELVSTER